jgi:hypothetical protein
MSLKLAALPLLAFAIALAVTVKLREPRSGDRESTQLSAPVETSTRNQPPVLPPPRPSETAIRKAPPVESTAVGGAERVKVPDELSGLQARMVSDEPSVGRGARALRAAVSSWLRSRLRKCWTVKGEFDIGSITFRITADIRSTRHVALISKLEYAGVVDGPDISPMIRDCLSAEMQGDEFRIDAGAREFVDYSGRESFDLKFDSLACR